MAASCILYLVIGGIVFWLLFWLINYLGLPEPFNKIAHVVLAILAVFVIIGILISMVGGTPLFKP